MTSDMTAVTVPPQTLMSTGRAPVGLPPVPPATVATILYTHPSMHTVDHALPVVNVFQFSTMTADRRDVAMPLYTVSAAPAVTAVVSTAAHTISSLLDDVCARHAPSGAFITHASHGPIVSFPISAYPEWGGAPVGYPNPDFALPTPAVVGPTISATNTAPTLLCTIPTVSSLPVLTDITSATTTTAVADSVASSVSGKLAAGLQVLALAPRPSGVPTDRHFRFRPPPRQPLNRLQRQHQLQFSYPAA